MIQLIRQYTVLLLILIIFNLQSFGNEPAKDNETIKIDSVTIRKNWRTKEEIILRELNINKGDNVTESQIENSIARIWNIGNFAKVSYTIDTLETGKLLLNITAQDALTIMPVLSFIGNREEYKLNLGIFDNNMLGRNISLGLEGSFGTNARYGNINIGIPRQLLYRNMTIGGRFSYGTTSAYRYEEGVKVSGVGYSHSDINMYIGNPWHDDYSYKFSPDLSLGYFNHQTDSALTEQGISQPSAYTVNYLTVATAESIGLMNRKRHQREGYNISAGIGAGIGLSVMSPAYVSAGLSGVYSKLLGRFLQIDGSISSGYTTTGLPSLINYLGPGHVKGILSGERAGKSIISSTIALRLTYINRNWFAMEQSFFINAGNAADVYWHLFNTPPLASAGSSIRLMVPMIPWLAISFHYAWMGNAEHWFSADF